MRTFERKVETDDEMTWFNIQPTEVVEEKNQNEWAGNSICNSQRTDERNISRIKKRPESSDRRGTRILGGITKSHLHRKKGNALALLLRMYIGAATTENNMQFP